MNMTSEDIKDLLEDAGLGLVHKTNLFIGLEPDSPDNTVTVFDTPGRAPQLTLDNKGYFYPSIQIRVRNNRYDQAESMIQRIKIALHGIGHLEINGTMYNLIQCTGEPFPLGFDDSKRSWWVANFDIQRTTT